MSTLNNSIETTAAFCFFAAAKNPSFCFFRQNGSQQRPSVQLQLKDLTKTVEI